MKNTGRLPNNIRHAVAVRNGRKKRRQIFSLISRRGIFFDSASGRNRSPCFPGKQLCCVFSFFYADAFCRNSIHHRTILPQNRRNNKNGQHQRHKSHHKLLILRKIVPYAGADENQTGEETYGSQHEKPFAMRMAFFIPV